MNNVYLFPLTNSLTLSRLALPYHIFEPRYKQMVQDAMSESDYISVLLPKDSYAGQICTLGKLDILHTYPDERMDIIITGIKKVRLTDKIAKETPYLVYDYQEIKEDSELSEDERHDLKILRNLILKRFKKSLEMMGNFEQVKNILCEPEVAINYASFFLLNSMEKKEEILAIDSFSEKLEVLLNALNPDCSCLTRLLGRVHK